MQIGKQNEEIILKWLKEKYSREIIDFIVFRWKLKMNTVEEQDKDTAINKFFCILGST